MPSDHKSKIEKAIAAAARRANGGDSDNENEEMKNATASINHATSMHSVDMIPVPTEVFATKQKKQISFDPKSTANDDHHHHPKQSYSGGLGSGEKHPASVSKYPGHDAFPPVNEAWAYQPATGGAASSVGDGDDYAFGSSAMSRPSIASGETGGNNSGSSDSDDPLTGGSTSGSSASSLSSNAKRSKEIAARPMMLYMVCLIMVPITFLTIYQGLNVGFALETLQFMRDHELVVEHMLELSHDLEEQMILDSELIGLSNAYNLPLEISSSELPSWVPDQLKKDAEIVEKNWVDSRASLSDLLKESSEGDGAIPEFHDRAIGLPEFIARSEMAGKRYKGDLLRSYIKHVLTELSVMLAILQQDEHAEKFALEMADLQLIARINEHVSYMFAYYREIEYAYNKSYDLLRNHTRAGTMVGTTSLDCSEFASTYGKVETLISYLITGSGNVFISNVVTSFRDGGWQTLVEEFKPLIKCQFSNSSLEFNDDLVKNTFDSEIKALETAALTLFLKIVDNEDVKNTALVEGMKILGAVLACVVGVAILIVVQKNERRELLQIIDHSERLATAVRRFVPKNQLRMMGIRTVLQAEAGYNTEVSQGLVHNAMRNFAQVSEQMQRTELFEWLQMYVARMTYVVQQQRGYLDSVLGDSTFSVFPQAIDAVGAAILMQQETDHMNIDLTAQRNTDLVRVGVGVHFGVVVAGVFGDEGRLACTMVASDVNLCQRLNELTRNYGNRIMLSRAVIDQIDADAFEVRSLGKVNTDTDTNLEIFDLYQADPPVLKTFKNSCREDFELGIRLSLSDKNEERMMAKDVFEELIDESNELQIVDIALIKKLEEYKLELAGVVRTTLAGGAVQLGGAGGGLHKVGSGSLARTGSGGLSANGEVAISLADADGERYEELLRKSSALREKRKSSLAKRSPGLQNLELSGVTGASVSHVSSGTGASTPSVALNLTNVESHNNSKTNASNSGGFSPQQQPHNQQHQHLTASNVNQHHQQQQQQNQAGAFAGAVTNNNNNNNVNDQQDNNNNNNSQSASQQQQLSSTPPGNENQFMRIGSDFAPRVQSFGYSSVATDESRTNINRYSRR